MSPIHASGLLLGAAVAALTAAAFSLPDASSSPASSSPTASSRSSESATAGEHHVSAPSRVEAGRYLVTIAGCNDCHTPGFMERGLAVPEDQWLTGVPVGWRGPWGTTYASNLRLFVQETPLDVWLSICADRATRPPMPWDSLHSMSREDRESIHAYITSLGPAGEKMPAYCEPCVEPRTPCLLLDPGEVGFRRAYAAAPRARLRPAAEVEAFEALGLPTRVLVASGDTRDAFSLVEQTVPARAEGPVLALQHHDGVVEVLEGELDVLLAGRRLHAAAGDRVVVPRGTSHALASSGDRPARVRVTTSPGGYDDFLAELAELDPERDGEELAELYATYGVEPAAR